MLCRTKPDPHVICCMEPPESCVCCCIPCIDRCMMTESALQDNTAFVAAWKGCSSATAVRHLDVEAPQLFQVEHDATQQCLLWCLLMLDQSSARLSRPVSGPAQEGMEQVT